MGRQPEGPWQRGGKGQYVVKIDGVRWPLGWDHDEAWRRFHALMADRDKLKRKAAPMTLRGLAELYLDSAEGRVAETSFPSYQETAKSFVAQVGSDFVAEAVKPLHVSGWIASHPRWNTTTRRKKIGIVKRMFRWAKSEGYLEANALADIKLPPGLTREVIMTDEQFRAVLAEVKGPHLRDFLVAMRETGARPSEIMRLEARHIDWAAKVARMHSKTTKKTRRIRVLYLTDRMLDLCRSLATQWTQGPIFRNSIGNPWRRGAIHHRLKKIREKLGYGAEVVSESLRHQWATDALVAGVPIATVATMMGHVDTAMVSRHYSKLHERTNHLHEALEKIRPPDPPESSGPAAG